MAVDADARVRELEGTVSALERSLRSAEQALRIEKAAHRRTMDEVGRLANNIGELEDSLRSFRGEFLGFRKEFRTFVEDDRLATHKQFAQTMVSDIRAQRDRNFGHYDKVRNVALGMLQAMDAGIVTAFTMQQAAERLMIEVPGYWLSPVQVALAAWISDNEELANRALMGAMANEANKTALFFCLVLARHEREDATFKWMREYLDGQDPLDLPRDFTVVLDAAAQGALGVSSSKLARDRCFAWIDTLKSSENIVREQSARWQQRMSRNRISISTGFSQLARISPDWAKVSKWLDGVTALEQTEVWLRQIFETTVVNLSGQHQRADEVLQKLVRGYDGEEDSLRQQERLWETVVEQGGDQEAAERILQDAPQGDESQGNFFDLLTTIGIAPETVGASDTTRHFAIRLASDWITSAAQTLCNASRENQPRSIKIEIGEWSGDLAADGGDKEVAAGDYGRFVEQEVANQLKLVTLIKPTSFTVITFVVLCTFVYELIAHLADLQIFAPINAVALILTGASLLWLKRAREALPERREEAIARGEERKRAGQERIRQAAAEFGRVFQRWEDELAKEKSLADFLREQAAPANLLSLLPASGVSSSTKIPPASTQPRLTERSSADAGESAVFAIDLPSWDLEPPPHNTSWLSSSGHEGEARVASSSLTITARSVWTARAPLAAIRVCARCSKGSGMLRTRRGWTTSHRRMQPST
jgi:hypothetical protein